MDKSERYHALITRDLALLEFCVGHARHTRQMLRARRPCCRNTEERRMHDTSAQCPRCEAVLDAHPREEERTLREQTLRR